MACICTPVIYMEKKRDKEGAMPSKYRMILDLASQTAKNITADADRYTDFLITAANNYK